MTNASLPIQSQPIRQLSSMPNTHRATTLNAIRQHTHALGSKIEYLKTEHQRMKKMIAKAPGQGQSRLDWLANQLNANK